MRQKSLLRKSIMQNYGKLVSPYLKTPTQTAVLCLMVYKELLAVLLVGVVGKKTTLTYAKHPLVSYRTQRLKGQLIGE